MPRTTEPVSPPKAIAPIGDDLHAAARDWVVALVSGDVDEATLDEFKRWRTASPAHDAAFEVARELYAGAGTHKASLHTGRVTRRHAGFAAAALAASLALGLFFARPEALFPPDHATPDGPAQRIALADGSTMLLDGGGAVDIRMTDTRREIALLRGRAWFEVAPDRARPFTVTAHGGRATAIGTAFAVDATGAQTRVDVTHGIVGVEAGDEQRLLHIGEAARWSTAGLSAAPGGDALAWREGKIVIRNRRFGEAVRLLDNYIPGRIVILGDIALARVGGVFDSRNAENGLRALARSQGAHIRQLGSLTIVSAW